MVYLCHKKSYNLTERYKSGLIGTPGKRVSFTGPRVRIPPFPLTIIRVLSIIGRTLAVC